MLSCDADMFTTEFFDSVIQTQGIKINLVLNEYEAMSEDYIKRQLASKLAEAIIEKQLCEFTMIPNQLDFSKMYMIRAYLTPREQCKILRQAKPMKV